MSKQIVSTSEAPAAIGPYSQAVRWGGLVYTSGQIALDPAGGQMVGAGDVEAETRQVLANLRAVLATAGAGFGDVLKTTMFLADLGDFAKVNAIYAAIFDGAPPPARSTIQAAALPRGAKVEIDMIAVDRGSKA
jgi:reactive intermediate/imine deaminase